MWLGQTCRAAHWPSASRKSIFKSISLSSHSLYKRIIKNINHLPCSNLCSFQWLKTVTWQDENGTYWFYKYLSQWFCVNKRLPIKPFEKYKGGGKSSTSSLWDETPLCLPRIFPWLGERTEWNPMGRGCGVLRWVRGRRSKTRGKGLLAQPTLGYLCIS